MNLQFSRYYKKNKVKVRDKFKKKKDEKLFWNKKCLRSCKNGKDGIFLFEEIE